MPDKYTKEAEKLLPKKKYCAYNKKWQSTYPKDCQNIGYAKCIADCIPIVADLLEKIDELKAGSIEVGVEDKRTLIKIRTSDNAHSFINWSYDWREIPKLCKKAKEELYNQLLILADKVKKEKKEKE